MKISTAQAINRPARIKPGRAVRCRYEKGLHSGHPWPSPFGQRSLYKTAILPFCQTSEIDEIADKGLQQGIYFAEADTTEGNCAIGTNTCAYPYPSVVKLLDDLMVSSDQGLNRPGFGRHPRALQS